jgi:putative DNA primase/helicase
VQEPTLREFFNRSGALARGTGFLARFLVAWPESTQGSRFFTEAPDNWPHVAAFDQRIAAILNHDAPINDDKVLEPPLLAFSPEAKAAWVEFHNQIESELRSGGELYDVRDVASKAADNAARLATLFQIFEHGIGAVSLESFESASRIVAWHLNESRRFFGELALPVEIAYAVRLDTWLLEYCKRERKQEIATREAQRLGPLREKESLTQALQELADLNRIRVTRDGKKKTVNVNPLLLGAKS